jgi:hypothetical protein
MRGLLVAPASDAAVRVRFVELHDDGINVQFSVVTGDGLSEAANPIDVASPRVADEAGTLYEPESGGAHGGGGVWHGHHMRKLRPEG